MPPLSEARIAELPERLQPAYRAFRALVEKLDVDGECYTLPLGESELIDAARSAFVKAKLDPTPGRWEDKNNDTDRAAWVLSNAQAGLLAHQQRGRFKWCPGSGGGGGFVRAVQRDAELGGSRHPAQPPARGEEYTNEWRAFAHANGVAPGEVREKLKTLTGGDGGANAKFKSWVKRHAKRYQKRYDYPLSVYQGGVDAWHTYLWEEAREEAPKRRAGRTNRAELRRALARVTRDAFGRFVKIERLRTCSEGEACSIPDPSKWRDQYQQVDAALEAIEAIAREDPIAAAEEFLDFRRTMRDDAAELEGREARGDYSMRRAESRELAEAYEQEAPDLEEGAWVQDVEVADQLDVTGLSGSEAQRLALRLARWNPGARQVYVRRNGRRRLAKGVEQLDLRDPIMRELGLDDDAWQAVREKRVQVHPGPPARTRDDQRRHARAANRAAGVGA